MSLRSARGPRPARRRRPPPHQRCGTGSTSTRTPPAASWPRPATWRRTGPAPYGLDADPLTQLMIDEELRRKGVRRPINPIGIGWAGPTLMYAGTEEQKERWLWPLLSGEEFWCQLFSEPGAGSDLAALTHPGRARRRPLGRQRAEGVDQLRPHRQVGDPAGPYRPHGHQAHGDQLLRLPHGRAGDRHPPAHRHDGGARLQRGVPDGRADPGRPSRRARARWMGAGQGHPGQRACLAVGRGGAVGDGPDGGGSRVDWCARPAVRPTHPHGTGLVDVWVEAQILRVLRLRMVSAVLAGRAPGAEASVRKAIADAHGQHIMDVARDLAGPFGMLAGTGPVGGWADPQGGRAASADPTWSRGFLFSPGPDHRRRHGRGPAQHRGRKGSRSAARSLTLTVTHTVRGCLGPRRATALERRTVAMAVHPVPCVPCRSGWSGGPVGSGSGEPMIGRLQCGRCFCPVRWR